MNILDKLNTEYQIKVENNTAYDMQNNGEIIATSKQDLAQFYINSYEYKAECLFDDEIGVYERYKDIMKQLKELF